MSSSNGVSNGNGGSDTNGNGGAVNGTVNGKVEQAVQVGDIPHITTNIIPLSSILKFYSQESYKQLTNVIENLSANSITELDSKRKSQLLQVLISLRKDFIKIYTLVKWASVSKDVSKLIDLLNWFRIQDSYFENLAYGINELNRYSGAKLPNPDLITAIEVLIQGRPQLPSYNIIPQEKISSSKVLKVLKSLNLVLTTRMALHSGDDDIPKRLLSNYVVGNGRIYFTIPNEFQVSISVANDNIVYDHSDKEEYSKSPFYFVDFKFLFGINPETLLITHDNSASNNKDISSVDLQGEENGDVGTVATKLPISSFQKLEKISNQVLLNSGLKGLYELLHRYSISFKLYLISRQLRNFAVNSKWRGNIQYQYQKSLIVINYWSSQYLSSKWKSFIELGVDKDYNLNFRWFKNGKYIEDHGIVGVFQKDYTQSLEGEINENNSNSPKAINSSSSSTQYQDLSVEMILNLVANKHSEGIINRIHQKLNDALGGGSSNVKDVSNVAIKKDNLERERIESLAPESPSNVPANAPCTLITPHQLLIKLTRTKSTVFAINPLTGFFYFVDPSPIQQQTTRLINSPPPSRNNSVNKFISEREMIDYIINQLLQLRLETFKREINNKLITTEWIANDIIKLSDYESGKLFNFVSNERQIQHSQTNKIQYYRRKNWPSSWFLLNLISGINLKSYWWVARIKSIKGEWKIQWVEMIKDDVDEEGYEERERNISYQFCHNLSTKCSNMIIDHIILEELHSRKIKYVKISKKDSILKKFDIREPSHVKKEGQEVVYESMIGLFNENLIPLSNSSSIIILKVELVHSSANGSLMKLSLYGKLRNFKIKEGLTDTIRLENDLFEVNDEIVMIQALGAPSNNPVNESFLGKLFQHLSKLDNLIKIINQLNEYYSYEQIKTISLNQVEFTIDKEFGNLTINIEDTGISLTIDSSNQSLQLLVTYLNRYLASGTTKRDVITGVIKYFQLFLRPIKMLSTMKSKFIEEQKLKPKLNNGINKVNFEFSLRSFDSCRINMTVNSFQPQSKKMNRDKISFDLSLRTNKFFKGGNEILYLISYKSNFSNPSSVKYKRLFESIHNGINELRAKEKLIKLNHDIMFTDAASLEKVLDTLRECSLSALNEA
ncbi:mediator of RNA polymerase II transcription subunit 14 [[Candida] railenensis]|uniref:Mediator of RNA polymerase II transcription subunit 14 n=1 Tax=[Candida] railenensis TaxID=45579 RepID=A0A9P0QM84_9ASCO|nr:mediator of RNA polymerase II transcription subunit 14 [[Candida] railenensis]